MLTHHTHTFSYSKAFGDGPRNLNRGQETRTTPELAPVSSNFHTNRRMFEPRHIYRASVPSTRTVFSGTRLELKTHRSRVRFLNH
ncbi:hypothetical protein TNCV_236121 [Trichonephila clavipes]|nr:hypothetical protein TNCV_236121 [Trichonephila clavipes]